MSVECTSALVDGNVSNATVELDLVNFLTGERETVTVGPINGSANVSTSDQRVNDLASISLDAAAIEEARLVDSDGTVLDSTTNSDLGLCVDVLGIDVADVDTELALDLGLLDGGLNESLSEDQIATLVAGLNNTEIELLNGAVDTGEISNDELVNLANLREGDELNADELGDALRSGDVGGAIDSLLDSLLPGLSAGSDTASGMALPLSATMRGGFVVGAVALGAGLVVLRSGRH